MLKVAGIEPALCTPFPCQQGTKQHPATIPPHLTCFSAPTPCLPGAAPPCLPRPLHHALCSTLHRSGSNSAAHIRRTLRPCLPCSRNVIQSLSCITDRSPTMPSAAARGLMPSGLPSNSTALLRISGCEGTGCPTAAGCLACYRRLPSSERAAPQELRRCCCRTPWC